MRTMKNSKRQKGERVTDNNSTITTRDEIQTVQQLKMKVKQWNIETVKQWNSETVKQWNIETLKHWNIETLKHWNIETLKHWNKLIQWN